MSKTVEDGRGAYLRSMYGTRSVEDNVTTMFSREGRTCSRYYDFVVCGDLVHRPLCILEMYADRARCLPLLLIEDNTSHLHAGGYSEVLPIEHVGREVCRLCRHTLSTRIHKGHYKSAATTSAPVTAVLHEPTSL